MAVFLVCAVAAFVIAFVAYAIYLRRRDAAARRAWEQHCNEQALANNAALAARRSAARPEKTDQNVTVDR
ncbi:hypothetical protein PX554_01715 [Sphingomonas sp. H39-1-10]|uniref:hypothetical protein n=1 Tax=Sphingomonas TaxID=13687 RepID=UPI000888409D|nr:MULTISPECIES: hypothetical protein [Sphingomonas]MDF0486832.1 hypothetical protein [Sphingomonas pollutisoli]SDA34989.1 hypothetical protein SAMN03159340_03148 [Sphingomonas sp. NFR15]